MLSGFKKTTKDNYFWTFKGFGYGLTNEARDFELKDHSVFDEVYYHKGNLVGYRWNNGFYIYLNSKNIQQIRLL